MTENTQSAVPNVVYEITDERLLTLPLSRNTPGSSGFDLRACIKETLILLPNEVKLISSGIKLDMQNQNMTAFVLPRSGLGHKKGLVLGNLTGVIDSDYTGPLMISAWNRSLEPIEITPLDRIAQLVFLPIIYCNMVPGLVSTKSERGEKGFGSSGTS